MATAVLLHDMTGGNDPELAVKACQLLDIRADTILEMIEDLDDGWLETKATKAEIEKVKKVAEMIKQHRAEVGV